MRPYIALWTCIGKLQQGNIGVGPPKPPGGWGLNVSSEVSYSNCWSLLQPNVLKLKYYSLCSLWSLKYKYLEYVFKSFVVSNNCYLFSIYVIPIFQVTEDNRKKFLFNLSIVMQFLIEKQTWCNLGLKNKHDAISDWKTNMMQFMIEKQTWFNFSLKNNKHDGPYHNYGYADLPPLLRSCHLDIKKARWANNKDGRKISYHIISRLGAQKLNFFLKWSHFQGRLELTCKIPIPDRKKKKNRSYLKN